MSNAPIVLPDAVHPPRCKHYLSRKQRCCTAFAREGSEFCTIHAEDESRPEAPQRNMRVPCPYLGTHTVRESDLQRHMKICPDRTALPDLHPAFRRGINLTEAVPVDTSQIVKFRELKIPDQKRFAAWLEDTAAQTNISEHPQKMLDLSAAALTSSKDCAQHEAIAQHVAFALGVDELGQVSERAKRFGVIEFGAGKAGLAVALQHALFPGCPVILVDRSHFRDCKEKGLARRRAASSGDDAEMDRSAGTVHRIKMDVADFDLEAMLTSDARFPDWRHRRWIAVGKHLCGGCTDVSLRCLCRAAVAVRVAAIAIAPCCHQLCSREALCPDSGHDMFPVLPGQEAGIDTFECVRRVAGWAVAGNVAAPEEVRLGRLAKRLVDHGRVMFLRTVFARVELATYVGTDVTPENVLLLAWQAPAPLDTL